MARPRRPPTFSEFRSSLIVEQAYQEIVRLHFVDYNAGETFQKISLSPTEFAALQESVMRETYCLRPDGTTMFGQFNHTCHMECRLTRSSLDYIVNDRAMYLRRMSPLQLDLAAKFAEELFGRIVTMGDQEELRPLAQHARYCITSFDQRRLTRSEGTWIVGQHEITSFRDPDVHLEIQSPSLFYGSEIIIEITDPAKRLLCPNMAEGYVRGMEDRWLNHRNYVLYIGINLQDETPVASYTVMTGKWKRPPIRGGRWRLIPYLLHRDIIFRDHHGKLVPGALTLKPQTILGHYLVDETFRAPRDRGRAKMTTAVSFDHAELFRYVEYAEKKLVNRLLPHIGIRELQLKMPKFEGRRFAEEGGGQTE
ncbi:hypothetical protein IWZ01DRAFT_562116 [Phyllosticta capitalensis]